MSGVPDYALETTFSFCFTTRRFTTGAPFTLAGTPALSVKESGNDTPITAGITLDVDTCATPVTGLNEAQIVATAANGYESGKTYAVYISTGTVDSVSVVGEVVYQFTIEKQSALRPTTAGRTLDVSATGEAGLDWANVGSPTTVVGLSGTTIKTATDVETDTADIQTRLPAALVSGRMDASVGAMAADVVTAAALAADAGAEIADAVWDEARAGHVGAGSFGEGVASVQGNVTGSVASVTGAVGSVTASVTVGTNNDKTGYSLTATTGLGNQTANITGNLSGSVGSVTGAVGSVTGAVGSVTAPVAITSNIKQNQALAGFTFLMTDSTNHNPATGLTVTVTRSIDGGAFGAGTLSAVTEVSNGVYKVDFGAGDLNGKNILLRATAAASDDTFERIVTQV